MATSESTITVTAHAELSPLLSKGLRAVVVDTYIAHQRISMAACSCGELQLGSSFAEHMADLIMESL